ncbi:MAG: ribbon-helix-helix protein, CopG family [Opitutales bacterium]|nr:ribbon-helix-helix protein, CopG family [Opitutales bacterium]
MGRTPKSLNGSKESGMTQISISLPKPLVEQIDRMAEMDNRNRSNFIANTLSNMARDFANVAEAKKRLK